MQYSVDYWLLKALYDWQTLAAGLLALAGALWTVKEIRGQIQQTSDITEEVGKREEFAARAVLPLALSELTAYSQRCIRMLDLLSSGPVPSGFPVPVLEKDVIGVLQQAARYAPQDIAAKIWILLSNLQVQQSRLSGLVTSKSGEELAKFEIANNSLDAADIYAKTGDLYTYARDEDGMRKQAPPEKLRSAFHACGIYEEDEHPAMKYLNEKDARDSHPEEKRP